jgi:Domain of unknown function (DUF3291)
MAYALAQVNVGRLKAPLTDPGVADFVAALDEVNAQAERQDGFIWRLKGAGNNATDVRAEGLDPDQIINVSVWRDLATLSAFVYTGDHAAFMRRRAEWFIPERPYMALWWVEADHHPTAEEGLAALAALKANGPTKAAFTFAVPFPNPDGGTAAHDLLDNWL